MKKAFLLCGVLLALTATAANAQLNLAWEECYGGGGASNALFACNVNTGTNNLFGSAITPPGVTELNGMEPNVLVAFGSAGIPAWWTFGNAPNCRAATSLVSAFPGGGAVGSCHTFFGDNGGSGAHVSDANPLNPQQLRIRMVAAINNDLRGPVPAGSELYLFVLTINHARTTGTTVCGGCNIPAGFVFSSLNLTQPAGVGDFHYDANLATDHCALWQSGDCTPTPTRNATWGHIKSLYR